MSNTVRCIRCSNETNRGHAHIRSRNFQQVSWCDPCWRELRKLDEPRPPWLVRVVRQVLGRAA